MKSQIEVVEPPFVTMPVRAAIEMYNDHGIKVYRERRAAYLQNQQARDARLAKEREIRDQEVAAAQKEILDAYEAHLAPYIHQELEKYNAQLKCEYIQSHPWYTRLWAWLRRQEIPGFAAATLEGMHYHARHTLEHRARQRLEEEKGVIGPYRELHSDPTGGYYAKYSALELTKRQIERRWYERWSQELPEDPVSEYEYNIWREIDELFTRIDVKTYPSLPAIHITVTLPIRLMNPVAPSGLWIPHLEPELLRKEEVVSDDAQ